MRKGARRRLTRTILGALAALARQFRTGERAITEDVLFRYGGELRGAGSFWPLLWAGIFAPEYTLFDVLNVPRGVSWVAEHMRYDLGTNPLHRNRDASGCARVLLPRLP